MTIQHLLFGFRGRIRRRDWWPASIAALIAYSVAIAVAAPLILGSGGAALVFNAAVGSRWDVLALAVAAHLPFLWIQAALGAKRAHDRNRSALVTLALVIGTGLASYLPSDGFERAGRALDQREWWGAFGLAPLVLAVGAFVLIASLYLFVTLGFLDGTLGPNRFGRSPKVIGGDSADTTAEVFS